MDAVLRTDFNRRWTPQAYEAVVAAVNDPYPWKAGFRICETPIFFTDEWSRILQDAGDSILKQIQTPEFEAHAASAIPKGEEVPNPKPHPEFVQIDFAIAEENGRLVPKLIELQGFASMFCYQVALDRAYREAGLIPDGVSQYWSGLDERGYLDHLRKIIVGDLPLESVVLLETEPEKQRTNIDFSCTEAMLGVRTVDLGDLWVDGRTVRDPHGIEVKRIYNRVIFDELSRKDLNLRFHPTDDVDVDWVAHPNWFHKLSKHTLPFLKGESIPECHFVSDLKDFPKDLKNYVLKPLYSFAGAGVIVDVKKRVLEGIEHPEAYLLQRKVKYAPFLETPSGRSKAEVRLMYFWNRTPILAGTLVRISRGKLSSVSKNTDDTWIGATTGYHRIG